MANVMILREAESIFGENPVCERLWNLDASKIHAEWKTNMAPLACDFATSPFLFSMPEEFMIRLRASSKDNFQLPNRFVQ